MLELAGIIIFGILAQWVAWRFKLPAILPLILIGLLVGPISAEYLSADGQKWIEPIWNGEKGLFPGESLFYFVSLAIAIILFEGGLTLKISEIKNVGPVITKLITIGAVVTLVGGAVAAHFLFGLSWRISALFSALIIVTGPTVITPILRNVPLRKDVSAVLKWEGILIDPIGALVAVLVFEFISIDAGGEYTLTAGLEFLKKILIGSTFGFGFAHAFNFVVGRKWVPHYLLNVFALASVLGVFVVDELFAKESGLLAVVVMGMVLGNMKSNYLKELLYFKESLSILLISILFILLAANMNMDELLLVYNWQAALLLAIIIFVIRPLGVLISTRGSKLAFKEKLFISWVGPRGIVAAGIASLFGLTLARRGVPGAEYITPLVFMVVLGTVLLNAASARFLAKVFGVFLQKSEGILIVGASVFPRLIARYLKDNGRHVVLIDSNQENIRMAQEMDLDAMVSNIYSDNLTDNIELNDVGYLLAMTANPTINDYAIQKLGEHFGENGSHRLISDEEKENPDFTSEQGLFSHVDDFPELSRVAETYPQIKEIPIRSNNHYGSMMSFTDEESETIPLFIKDQDRELHIISSNNKSVRTDLKNAVLVYMGKSLNDIALEA
ncbi:cation:proton antiporter [Aureitalea marina]|uniref:Cell shape-determining protein n=1 Tax=Aureitalea marina TaxID=930804 RepID=A0A2S7KS53_9FLAO|nr:sodium:proton antiporter [Aureitalea marina]PQB05446.1 cell shape-determining protein [Aureitalea marina]